MKKEPSNAFQVWMFIIGIILVMTGDEMPLLKGAAGILLGIVFFIPGMILLWIKRFYYGRGVMKAYIVFGCIFSTAAASVFMTMFKLTNPPAGSNYSYEGYPITGIFFLITGGLLFIRAYLHKKWKMFPTSDRGVPTVKSAYPVNESTSNKEEIKEKIPTRPSERPAVSVNRPAMPINDPKLYDTLTSFTMKDIDAISQSDLPKKKKGDLFEHYCARLLKFSGYENIKINGHSGDRGADIICWKFKRKYIVQCKCYQNKVRSDDYYETHTARDNYSAGEAILLTNNYFTPQVIDMAAEHNVILWNREKLQELIDIANEEAPYENE